MFGTRAPSTQLRRRPADSAAERDPRRRRTPGATPAPAADHTAVGVSPPSTERRGAGSRRGSWRSDESARDEPGWSKRASVDTWQELRLTWRRARTVPARYRSDPCRGPAVHDQRGRRARGPPMITATNVVPKDMSSRYRETALAVLQKCLPVRPTRNSGPSCMTLFCISAWSMARRSRVEISAPG